MRLALAALGLAACSSGVVLPPAEVSSSARILVIDPDALPACGAIEARIGALGHLPPLAEITRGLVLEFDPALFGAEYDDKDSIAVLRMREEAHLPFDARDAIALPAPMRAWRLSGGAFESIVPPSDLRLAFARPNACGARYEERCAADATAVDPRCVAFERSEVYLPESQSRGTGGFAAVDHETALAMVPPEFDMNEGPDLYRLDAISARARSKHGLSNKVPWLGTYVSPSGEIWLYGPGDRVARGFFDDEMPFTIEVDGEGSFTGARTAWVDGPRDMSDPFEFFAISDDGAFVHYDGVKLTHLAGGMPDAAMIGASVAWIRSGEAIAAGPRRAQIIRAKDGRVAIEDVPLATNDRAIAVAYLPERGPILGTERGALMLHDGTAWMQLDSPLDESPVRGIVPFEGGFVFAKGINGSNAGRVVQYLWETGLCPAMQVADRDIRKLIARPGGGFIALSKEPPTDAFVIFVGAIDPHPECAVE